MFFASRSKRGPHEVARMALAAGIALAAGWPWSTWAQAQTRVWPTKLTNIAAAASGGRIIEATSVLDNDQQFTAENLIDGKVYNPANQNGSAGWASNKFDPINMDSVTIGFADNALKHIGRLVFNPSAAVAPERWAKDIEVQVSTDSVEGPYQPVGQITLRRAAEPQEFLILPTDARFMRLVFRANWGSDRAVALGEVEIYEAIDATDPLGGLIARLEAAVKELRGYRQVQRQTRVAGGRVSDGRTVDQTATSRPQSFSSETQAMLQLVQLAVPEASRALPFSDTNIAAKAAGGHIVDQSSIFNNNPDYGPENLIDGTVFKPGDDTGSLGWASEGFTPEREYVTLGFADDKPRSIGKVVLNPASEQSQLRWARTVRMQVTDGTPQEGPWRTVGTFNLQITPIDQSFEITPVEARYVRFIFLANGPASLAPPTGNPLVVSDRAVSLGEIQIYEPAPQDDVLEQLIGKLNQILVDLKQLNETTRLVPRKEAQAATAAAEQGAVTLLSVLPR